MGSGVTGVGLMLLLAVALGMGPSGKPNEENALFATYLAVTAAVMLAASLSAFIGPAKRALEINPTDPLRQVSRRTAQDKRRAHRRGVACPIQQEGRGFVPSRG